jgi:hypothetical protein
MAPKRQRLQAEPPTARGASERGAVPLSSSYSSEFLANTSASTVTNHSNNNGSLHNEHSAGPPMPAPAHTSDCQVEIYGALPGITRKITACAACRKNKVRFHLR